MRAIKLTNISEATIPIVTENGTTIYLAPRQTLENIEVKNYHEIIKFVRADVELREPVIPETKRVNLKASRKTYLKG